MCCDTSLKRKVDDKTTQYVRRLCNAQSVEMQQSLMSMEQVPADVLLFYSPVGIVVEGQPAQVSADHVQVPTQPLPRTMLSLSNPRRGPC